MPFHRYKQPEYTGAPALPAGPSTVSFNGVSYNLFNVVTEGNGSAGAAFIDGAKADGPNAGTYMVGFGEDARSSSANRGLRALAENTDFIDDTLNKDLATPVATNVATSGGAVATIALPAGTFVGNSGGYPLAGLFSVLDQNDNDILVSGSKLVVSSITGAAVGGGFSAGVVTLNLSATIPNGQQYRVYYANRGSLAALPVDALTSINIRSVEGIEAELQAIIRNIKGETVTGLDTAWDAAPVFKLAALGFNGLDGLYRRKTAVPLLGTFLTDAPGLGADIFTEGPALRAYLNASVPYESSSKRYGDTHQALIKTEESGVVSGGLGRTGFVSLMDETTAFSAGGLAVYDLRTLTGITQITASSSATLAFDGTNRLKLTLSGTDKFSTSNHSNIQWGFDLITLTLPGTIDGVARKGPAEVSLVLLFPFVADTKSAYVTGVSFVLPAQLASLAAPMAVTVGKYYQARVVNRAAAALGNPARLLPNVNAVAVDASTTFLTNNYGIAAGRFVGRNRSLEWGRFLTETGDANLQQQFVLGGALVSDGIEAQNLRLGTRPDQTDYGQNSNGYALNQPTLTHDPAWLPADPADDPFTDSKRGITRIGGPIVGLNASPYGLHGKSDYNITALTSPSTAPDFNIASCGSGLIRLYATSGSTTLQLQPPRNSFNGYGSNEPFFKTIYNDSARRIEFTSEDKTYVYDVLYPGECATYWCVDGTLAETQNMFYRVGRGRLSLVDNFSVYGSGGLTVSGASSASPTVLLTINNVIVPPRGKLVCSASMVRTGSEVSTGVVMGVKVGTLFLSANAVGSLNAVGATSIADGDYTNTTDTVLVTDVTAVAYRTATNFVTAYRRLYVSVFG